MSSRSGIGSSTPSCRSTGAAGLLSAESSAGRSLSRPALSPPSGAGMPGRRAHPWPPGRPRPARRPWLRLPAGGHPRHHDDGAAAAADVRPLGQVAAGQRIRSHHAMARWCPLSIGVLGHDRQRAPRAGLGGLAGQVDGKPLAPGHSTARRDERPSRHGGHATGWGDDRGASAEAPFCAAAASGGQYQRQHRRRPGRGRPANRQAPQPTASADIDWHDVLDELADLNVDDRISQNTYLQLCDAAKRQREGRLRPPARTQAQEERSPWRWM